MKNNIKFSLFLFAVLALVVNLVFFSDENISVLTDWITNNAEITEKVGKVSEVEIRNVTYVQEAPNSAAYNKYTFFIQGEKGDTIARIIENEKGDFVLKYLD